MFFFFKQKTAYEMRISDWSSDVCSSDLRRRDVAAAGQHADPLALGQQALDQVAADEAGSPEHGDVPAPGALDGLDRGRRDAGGEGSEEPSVGKECVSNGRFRWSPDP